MDKEVNYEAEPPRYEESSASGASRSSPTTFASMSMHFSDRLRLLRFPRNVISAIHQTITTSWPGGIQAVQDYYGSHEFKLSGYPWSGKGADIIFARRLMSRMLQTLAELGWVLTVSTDVTKKSTDKSTLLFRQQQPPPVPCDWLSVAFSQGDKIILIDAPQDLLDDAVRHLRTSIQRQVRHSQPGAYELKMHGYPWRATGGETMTARALLLQLLEILDRSGWTIYASIDQTTGPGGDASSRTETDTWHCRRRKDWIPGMPVYPS